MAEELSSSWEYTGYWNQRVAALPPGLQASFYVSPRPDRVLLGVMHLREDPVVTDIELDLGTLGMRTLSRATSLYHIHLDVRLTGTHWPV